MSSCLKNSKYVFRSILQISVNLTIRNLKRRIGVLSCGQLKHNYASICEKNHRWKILFGCNSQAKICTETGVSEKLNLLSMNPHGFAQYLKSNNINRCFIVWDDKAEKSVASHPELQELLEWMNSSKYYNKHEAIFMQLGLRTGCLMGAFVWKTDRGQAYGGIRLTEYSTMEDYLQTGLRLSLRMGVKAALSGIWVGGGKGLIPEPKDKQHIHPDFRQKLFCDYGDFVSSLNGCYITAMDIGVNAQDLYNVHSRTRWVYCIPEDIGGTGNPAALLGKGVICAMEAALDYLKMGTLQRKRVAVQGAGGVGFDVVSRLLSHGAEVYVTDSSQKQIDDLRDVMLPKAKGLLTLEKVPLGDLSILEYNCDIFSPCAIGHIFTPLTIPKINAKIICGTANAQVSSEEHCNLFSELGITYVFEFLPNRMAMVNSIQENYGRLYNDPEIEKHFDKAYDHSIYVLTKRILQEANEKQITVMEAANHLAEECSQQPHPLWPGRGKSIIQSLINGDWHLGKDFWNKRRNFATNFRFL